MPNRQEGDKGGKREAKRWGDKAMVEKQSSVRKTEREAESEGDRVLVHGEINSRRCEGQGNCSKLKRELTKCSR